MSVPFIPSVLVPSTSEYLGDLLRDTSIIDDKFNEYVSLIKLFMEQNCFQVERNFHKKHEGTLSLFLSNLFMR